MTTEQRPIKFRAWDNKEKRMCPIVRAIFPYGIWGSKMTAEQLLTKVREFATNNYCSCEGRPHDPENLMEKLLKECEKWEKKIDKNCQHDWAYDVPDLPRLRVCQLCGRKERREIIGISYDGLPDFSKWMPIIGDMDLDKTKKEAKKR